MIIVSIIIATLAVQPRCLQHASRVQAVLATMQYPSGSVYGVNVDVHSRGLRGNHPLAIESRAVIPCCYLLAAFKCTARTLGQSVLELLGSYSVAEYPLDLVITEGYTYHIMRLRGKKLITWTDLTPGQAIYHMANSLKQVCAHVCLYF